jgi:hypothetical protein
MGATESKVFFDKFITQLKNAYDPNLVKGSNLIIWILLKIMFEQHWCIFFTTLNFTEGKFGNYMQVNIQGDGPVTIQLESLKQSSKTW